MNQQRNSLSNVVPAVFLACLLASTLSAAAGGFEPTHDQCAVATAVDPGSTFRGYGRELVFFKVAVPSAGLLAVDVTPEATVGLIGRGCSRPGAQRQPVVLERSASHLVLAAEGPGTYLFRVASQDRAQPLGDVKLSSGFVSGSGGASGTNGEDKELIEIEPDPLSFPAPYGQEKELIEIEPDPLSFPAPYGPDKELIEIEPDPLIAGAAAGGSLHSMLAALCRSGEVDDHGDSFPCATFLAPNRAALGEIGNGWGDDGDVFQFVVGGTGEAEQWSVTLEATAAVETSGVLYDHSGRRLEVGAADDAGFRIARTLPSGTYFVRVEGRHGAEGPYALSVNASPW